jgi:DNA-binding response OmpR family regulator
MAKARIVEIKAGGAIVLLENQAKAWLPGQELSTQYNPLRKLSEQNLCTEGQELEVVVYDKELGGIYQLVSHIRVSNDPWNKVNNWPDNEAKEMAVHSVTENHAYGVIESGIRGVVDLADIYRSISFPRSWKHFKTISAGDVIAGYVKKSGIDFERRLVKLAPAGYIKNLTYIPGFLPILKKGPPAEAGTEETSPGKNREWITRIPPQIRHILVVDDDELFLKEMGDYLDSRDIETTRARSRDEVNCFLENPECPDVDIAVVDINLARNHDYVGFQAAKAIARVQTRCRIIMTTGDPVDISKISSAGGNLLVAGFLYKPFGIEELSDALNLALEEKPKKISDFFKLAPEEEELPLPVTPKIRSLHDLVSDLKNEIEAEVVALFSIHPLSYDVEIEAYAGISRERLEDYSAKLRYSPVKDAALGKETIFENKITNTPRYSKHRWLVTALRYESCIGCPIPVTRELEYCLFAFHGSENHFNDMDRYKVISTADRIAQTLEIQRLEETIRTENPFYLAGKTYGSMAHDLVNALNREFGLPAIFKIIDANTAIAADDKMKIRKYLEDLGSELKRAKEIVKTFRRMSRSQHEKETEIDVPEFLQKVSGIIKIEVEALNTEIMVNPPTEGAGIPGVIMKQTPFEQVLYNLFLNAAQQIKRFSFAREKGYILVECGVVNTGEGKDFLRVLVHDSGPGIHTCDFEKVFQKGFTTKEDGCGMGLDICRNILEQAGGRIRVLKSILFCGTTFEILIPLHTKRGITE